MISRRLSDPRLELFRSTVCQSACPSVPPSVEVTLTHCVHDVTGVSPSDEKLSVSDSLKTRKKSPREVSPKQTAEEGDEQEEEEEGKEEKEGEEEM